MAKFIVLFHFLFILCVIILHEIGLNLHKEWTFMKKDLKEGIKSFKSSYLKKNIEETDVKPPIFGPKLKLVFGNFLAA